MMMGTTEPNRGLVLAWALVVACSAWLLFTTPVFPQEAYYWLYGKHPSLSYLDHPPMVGWLSYASTALLGDGVLGLRAPALLSALGTTWVGLALIDGLGGGARAKALWVASSVAVPAFTMTHFLMLPDGPLVFFWSLTVLALWRARCSAALAWWITAGAAAGCALLSKYTAAFLLPGGILVLLLDPQLRRQLRSAGPWVALALAAVLFLPVVVWNAEHHWVSFGFQTSSRYEGIELGTHWLLQFAAGQAALLLPLLLIAWAALPWMLGRLVAGSVKALWLASFGLPLFAFMLVNSLAIHVKINWVLPAYVTFAVAACLWLERCALDGSRPRLVKVFAASLPLIAALSLAAPLAGWYPQAGNEVWTGWGRLAAKASHWKHVIDADRGPGGGTFYFCENDHDSSMLWRNLLLRTPADPDPTVVAAQNVFGYRALEYDDWAPLGAELGQDAVFVLTNPERRQHNLDKARTLFRSVRLAEHVDIQGLFGRIVSADIYLCRGYTGA